MGSDVTAEVASAEISLVPLLSLRIFLAAERTRIFADSWAAEAAAAMARSFSSFALRASASSFALMAAAFRSASCSFASLIANSFSSCSFLSFASFSFKSFLSRASFFFRSSSSLFLLALMYPGLNSSFLRSSVMFVSTPPLARKASPLMRLRVSESSNSTVGSISNFVLVISAMLRIVSRTLRGSFIKKRSSTEQIYALRSPNCLHPCKNSRMLSLAADDATVAFGYPTTGHPRNTRASTSREPVAIAERNSNPEGSFWVETAPSHAAA
mmetsp:Transcript_5594/g.8539  ORF Transcript_5594/g.8539 Transcript_5594/m.8539 type:complete len:270 (+) Transcript_5594:2862-3671(+)